MPRPPLQERAALYVAKMPAAESGAGGHNATFAVAMVLVQGFGLSAGEARPILDEYNQRCTPPWSERELEHKLKSAEAQQGFMTQEGLRPRGCLADGGDANRPSRVEGPRAEAAAPRQEPVKAAFDPELLRRFAGDWSRTVDLVWLANRSVFDPALVSSERFLKELYGNGEKVVVFDNERSQGQALWPDEDLPTRGPEGVWYLCQPTDGEYHPNDDGKLSRRSKESVTAWRFLVIESDDAPARLWLGALVQMPLRIAAIYTSGGRSVHALVRVDAGTKANWDAEKLRLRDGLVTLGADERAMSAVRLTRLPGCWRLGKRDKQGRYQRFERPQLQKLLYLNPEPQVRPLCDMLARRDVVADWLRHAEAAPADGGDWVRKGLEYYATVSAKCRQALGGGAE